MNPQNKQSGYDVYAAIGRMTVRFNDLNNVLIENLTTKIGRNKANEFMECWQNGSNFYDLIEYYKAGPKAFKDYHENLDDIRKQRNEVIHNTFSDKLSKKLINKCNRVCEMIDKVIRGLEHETVHNASRNWNAKKKQDRKTLIECARQCRPYKEGYVRLSDLGNVLNDNDVRYNRKLLDVCQELGFRTECEKHSDTEVWFVKVPRQ